MAVDFLGRAASKRLVETPGMPLEIRPTDQSVIEMAEDDTRMGTRSKSYKEVSAMR